MMHSRHIEVGFLSVFLPIIEVLVHIPVNHRAVNYFYRFVSRET